ncbi:uncharacterized protein LOC121377889 [Gigantopelta aegis]|uniref:uncharacterized protein LOC121377889 n=1 Tax=Gigantopelta aegis TaxID=1735272 RepID=UPI001B88AA07|nr:uncharacterized protein LOC121377889 [Gigantopelta aegis]
MAVCERLSQTKYGNQRQNDPGQSPEQQSSSSLTNESKYKQADDNKPDEQKQNNGNQRQDDPGQSPDNSNTGKTIEDESIDFMLHNSKDNMNNDEPSPNFTASHEDIPMHSIEIISLPTSDNNDWEHLQVQQGSMSLERNGCQSRHTPYTEESTNELASEFVFVGRNDSQPGVDLHSDVMHSEDNTTTGKTTEQNLTNSAHREGDHGESTYDSYTGKSVEEKTCHLSGDEDDLSEEPSNAGKTEEHDSSVGLVQEETKDVRSDNSHKSKDTTEQTSSNMITGNQPPGKMSHKIIPDLSCPGYEGHGVIVIDYYFEDGTQMDEHPNLGKPYHGTRRRGFLPDTVEGQSILQLLKIAFDRKLTFTIGQSTTTGREDTVTWGDIPHKTNTHGGPDRNAFPDATYFSHVREQLAAKGVTG